MTKEKRENREAKRGKGKRKDERREIERKAKMTGEHMKGEKVRENIQIFNENKKSFFFCWKK
jgi:hypothetical protein